MLSLFRLFYLLTLPKRRYNASITPVKENTWETKPFLSFQEAEERPMVAWVQDARPSPLWIGTTCRMT